MTPTVSSNRITVAFSTFRETYFEWVVELLRALEKQTVKDFELIIVVNKNKEYFQRIFNAVRSEVKTCYDVRVLFNPVDKGIAYARNVALKHVKTPYLAYTDDDAVPDPCWLEELIGALKLNERVGAVSGPVLGRWEPSIENYAAWFPRELYWVIGCTPWDIKEVKPVRNGFASNLALKREVALNLGGFDENFGYNPSSLIVGEEPEFGIRLLKGGYVTLWNPQAKVYHRISEDRIKMRNILRRAFVEGKTKAFLSKTYGKATIKLEIGHLWSVIKSYIEAKSLKAKALLLITTIAVLTSYLAHTVFTSNKKSRVRS